jgi:hypothetical protein
VVSVAIFWLISYSVNGGGMPYGGKRTALNPFSDPASPDRIATSSLITVEIGQISVTSTLIVWMSGSDTLCSFNYSIPPEMPQKIQ